MYHGKQWHKESRTWRHYSLVHEIEEYELADAKVKKQLEEKKRRLQRLKEGAQVSDVSERVSFGLPVPYTRSLISRTTCLPACLLSSCQPCLPVFRPTQPPTQAASTPTCMNARPSVHPSVRPPACLLACLPASH